MRTGRPRVAASARAAATTPRGSSRRATAPASRTPHTRAQSDREAPPHSSVSATSARRIGLMRDVIAALVALALLLVAASLATTLRAYRRRRQRTHESEVALGRAIIAGSP